MYRVPGCGLHLKKKPGLPRSSSAPAEGTVLIYNSLLRGTRIGARLPWGALQSFGYWHQRVVVTWQSPFLFSVKYPVKMLQ